MAKQRQQQQQQQQAGANPSASPSLSALAFSLVSFLLFGQGSGSTETFSPLFLPPPSFCVPDASSTPAPTPGSSSSQPINPIGGGGQSGPPRNQQQQSSNPLSQFTPDQVAQLRMQMHQYKLQGKNFPVPPAIQQALMAQAAGSAATATDKKDAGGGGGGSGVVGERLGGELTRRVIEGVADVQHQAESRQQQQQQQQQSSGSTSTSTPVNRKFSSGITELDSALGSSSTPTTMEGPTHPLSNLAKHPATNPFSASKQQRLLMPSLLPSGLDPYLALEERNRFVQTRIDWRIAELETLDAMVGHDASGAEPVEGLSNLFTQPTADAKLRALIELKGLQLVDKQRHLRETALRSLDEAGALTNDRSIQKKVKKHALRDARKTEELERKQRTEREKKVKQKQNDYVDGICRHGRELVKASAVHADKGKKLGRMVLNYHVTTEKEEQKRVERISKERLRALKADDEEAYMALLDTAKDTRITHLLRQTDAFLDSLAQAVVAQQNDDVHAHGAYEAAFESESGPADESMFGAVNMVDEVGEETAGGAGAGQKDKVDYYAVAHRISEKVTAQPSILIGGTLKEYQIKGLQWMVSLYNNRLNGILADEMVRALPPSFSFSFSSRRLWSLTPFPFMLRGLASAGSREDDPDAFAHHVPDREEAAAGPVPRHRPSIDHHQLDARV